MAITWGAWEYASGNGMRVGIDYTLTAVDHNSGSCTLTVYWYTQNQNKYTSDAQGLHIGGAAFDVGDIGWADASFTNNAGGGSTIQRAAHTYTYYYTTHDYGTGAVGNVAISGTINGADNGVTPTCSINVGIPQRPVIAPGASSIDAYYINDTTAAVNAFYQSDRYAQPVDTMWVQRWDSSSNSWTGWYATSNGGQAMVAGATNLFQAQATNTAGSSGVMTSAYIQSTPAAPSACSVTLSGGTTSVVRWQSNQSTFSYNYTYTVQRCSSTNGGSTFSAWSDVATGLQGGSSQWGDSGLTPGTTYKYRVFATCASGGSSNVTLNSASSESNTILSEAVPAPPTGLVASRNSDTSFSLTWADHPSTSAPYDNITVQRFDAKSGAWTTIGTLSGTATALTDTGTTANNEYTWRIRGENIAGASDWNTSTTHRTTPAPATISSVIAVSSGGMKVTWVNNAPYTAYVLTLRYFKNGTLVSDTVAVPVNATSYTVTGLDITASYKFGIQTSATEGSSTLLSGWTDSASTPASVPPTAPTNLAPNGIAANATTGAVLTWTHNPGLDGAGQTQYAVEWRVAGASTWTNNDGESSFDGIYNLPASFLVDGTTYEWHVRTYGVNATPSPWSATATFTARRAPSVSVTSPATTLTTADINVSWTLGTGDVQSVWEVNLLDADLNLIEFETAISTVLTTKLNTQVQNGKTYTVQVRVQNQYGIWSSWQTKVFTANLPLPAPSTLVVTYASGTGAAILSLTPSTPTGAQLPAKFVNIQRRASLPEDPENYGDWADVATNLAPNATIIDTTPALSDRTQYRAVTYAEV